MNIEKLLAGMRPRRSLAVKADHPQLVSILGRLSASKQPTNQQAPQSYGQKVRKASR